MGKLVYSKVTYGLQLHIAKHIIAMILLSYHALIYVLKENLNSLNSQNYDMTVY